MNQTLSELRNIGQHQVEPSIYVPARFISIYISRFLVNTSLTPNNVTLAWGFCLFIASGLLAGGSREGAIIAGLLVAFSYVLDCVDGEIARLRSRGSDIGSILEQMVHWSTNLFILAGASIGMFRQTGKIQFLFLGLIVLIGDATFHFIYVSLRVAASPGASYGLLATITRWQFQLMPINTNLIMIGAFLGKLGVALWTWAIWSNIAWITAFTLFFHAEVRIEELRNLAKNALTNKTST